MRTEKDLYVERNKKRIEKNQKNVIDNATFRNDILNNYHLTEPAQRIVNREFLDKKVIGIKEQLGHDGADSEGWESDLWDLFLVTFENNQYIFYGYHWENWYQNDIHEYDLYRTERVKDLTDHSYYMEQICGMYTDDEDFRQFLRDM